MKQWCAEHNYDEGKLENSTLLKECKRAAKQVAENYRAASNNRLERSTVATLRDTTLQGSISRMRVSTTPEQRREQNRIAAGTVSVRREVLLVLLMESLAATEQKLQKARREIEELKRRK